MRRTLLWLSLAALVLVVAQAILQVMAIVSSRPLGLLWDWPWWEALLYALGRTFDVLVPAPAIVALVHAAPRKRWTRSAPLLVALALATYGPVVLYVGAGLLHVALPPDTQSQYIEFWIGYACQALPALVTLAYARHELSVTNLSALDDLEISPLRASTPAT